MYYVCIVYVLCMYYVCIMYVLCMYYVCIVYVLCMYYVCIVYVLCMYYVCIMYVLCKYYVCIMYVLCMYYVCIVYVLCMYYVCIMYVLCIPGEKEQILERNRLFFITFLDFKGKALKLTSYFERFKTLTPSLDFCWKLFTFDPFGPQGSPVTSQKMPGFVHFPILSTPSNSPPKNLYNANFQLSSPLTIGTFWVLGEPGHLAGGTRF